MSIRPKSTYPQAAPQHKPQSAPLGKPNDDARWQRLDPKGSGFMATSEQELDDLYELLVPAQASGKVRTETVACKVAIEVKQAMDMLVGSRATPFQTVSDVMRSALVYFMRDVSKAHKIGGKYREAIYTINMALLDVRATMKTEHMRNFIQANDTKIREFFAEGRIKNASELLIKAEEVIHECDDDDWRQMGIAWSKKIRSEMFPDIDVESGTIKRAVLKKVAKKGGSK